MAKIVLSALLSDIRGSLGGSTFANWKGQAYMRNKALAVSNPHTAAQALVRASFSARVAGWKILTFAERAAWEEYAQSRGSASWWEDMVGSQGLIPGKGRLLSGLNAFIGVNALLSRSGYATITAAPLPLTAIETPQLSNVAYGVGPPIAVTGDATTVENLAATSRVLYWARYEQAAGHAYIFAVSADESPGAPLADTFSLENIRVGHGENLQEVPISVAPGDYAFQCMLVDDGGHFSPASNIERVVVP